MKKYLRNLLMLPLAVALWVGCEAEEVTYQGQEFVMFADSSYLIPVYEKDTVFNVTVSSSVVCDYDRNYAVEVVTEKSTAIRGFHFDFAEGSNNITIKAGEITANVKLKANFNNVIFRDDLKARLRLVIPENLSLPAYGNETSVEFMKVFDLNMDEFLRPGGNIRMFATFPFSDKRETYLRTARKVNNEMIVVNGMFDNMMPLRMEFDNSEPLYPSVKVIEQPAFRDASYGEVWARTVDSYESYFIIPENFFVLYLEMYVPQMGSFGVHQYIMHCITEDEAKNEANGASPFLLKAASGFTN
ncbi:MAG: DUF4984 domain-containing protein [Bacteroidales bacterium]